MTEGLAPASAHAEKVQLDDVMLAMDVVDTLRHRQRMVERELGAEAREQELLERLRKIYSDQGIDVPEHILQDGVRALEEQRFVYTPPKDSLAVRLARVYVSRSRWWRKAAIALAVLAGLWGAWYVGWQRPRAQRAAALEQRMAVTLPQELDALRDEGLELAFDGEARRQIEALHEGGRSALERGDAVGAEDALARLKKTNATLRVQYAVRVVSRPGESSGVWRVPDDTPRARNFYLIVEAVDASGNARSVRITSEEDQQTRTVKKWGLSVDEATFDRVREDKLDDGIIQARRVGLKRRGMLEHEYTIETDGGAILDW